MIGQDIKVWTEMIDIEDEGNCRNISLEQLKEDLVRGIDMYYGERIGIDGPMQALPSIKLYEIISFTRLS